jgi:threonine/homoserine/homoserine lactone efflux protein
VCGTQGYAGAVGAAIQGIGAQREKSYEESLEEEEQQQQQTFAASHKRKVAYHSFIYNFLNPGLFISYLVFISQFLFCWFYSFFFTLFAA